MSILFYDHLIIKTDIVDVIQSSPEPDNVKGKALQLIDDIIHQEIIDFILGKLQSEKHMTFLTVLHERPYDPELIAYLKEHISPKIEEEIKSHGDKVIKKIIKDLQK